MTRPFVLEIKKNSNAFDTFLQKVRSDVNKTIRQGECVYADDDAKVMFDVASLFLVVGGSLISGTSVLKPNL